MCRGGREWAKVQGGARILRAMSGGRALRRPPCLCRLAKLVSSLMGTNGAGNLALKQELELLLSVPIHPFSRVTVYTDTDMLLNSVAVLLDVHN